MPFWPSLQLILQVLDSLFFLQFSFSFCCIFELLSRVIFGSGGRHRPLFHEKLVVEIHEADESDRTADVEPGDEPDQPHGQVGAIVAHRIDQECGILVHHLGEELRELVVEGFVVVHRIVDFLGETELLLHEAWFWISERKLLKIGRCSPQELRVLIHEVFFGVVIGS